MKGQILCSPPLEQKAHGLIKTQHCPVATADTITAVTDLLKGSPLIYWFARGSVEKNGPQTGHHTHSKHTPMRRTCRPAH